MANKPKTTPWNKIKAEYLAGATPKSLSIKYEITAKSITEKFSRESLSNKKQEIAIRTLEKVSETIINAEVTRTQKQLELADAVRELIRKELLKGISNPDFNPSSLKALTSSLLDLQKVERTAEGLDKDLKDDNKDDDEIIVRFLWAEKL